jgi:antitoxin (DNA-binding transcriptional repressor) of toxin-antitoxin stability system
MCGAAGEEIIIAKAGKPHARLMPLADRALRKPGGWEGKVWVADDFDEPLAARDSRRVRREGRLAGQTPRLSLAGRVAHRLG